MKLFTKNPAAETAESESKALPVDVSATVARVSDETRRKARIYFRRVSSASFALVCAGRESQLTTAAELAALRDAELNKDSLNEHFSKMRGMVKTALTEHCLATNALALPVLARALTMAEAESANLQVIESKAAERYGVPFAPSPTLAGLDALCVTIEDTVYAAAYELRGRIGVAALLAGILKL